jgi:hypothetical protein
VYVEVSKVITEIEAETIRTDLLSGNLVLNSKKTQHVCITPKVMVEWFTLLLRIWEGAAQGSNPDPENCYPDGLFRDIPQSLHANFGILP